MHPFDAWISGEKPGALALGLKGMLWVLSYPYAAAIVIRNRLFDLGWRKIRKAPVPVISVGNLTVGGTGKTPAVAFLARWFRQRDVRVAIVSRGYGALDDGRNDEAKELERKLPDVPHLQNPDRYAATLVATEELESQLVLLDDGFQHRHLHRDLNIVMLDALDPWGYGYLLPRGLLREPIRSLKRVDVVMVSRADQVPVQRLAELRTQVQRYAPNAAWVETMHQPQDLQNDLGDTQPLAWLAGKKVVAFCGLGNPRGFLKTLESTQAHVVHFERFPDHHPFRGDDILRLEQLAKTHQADALVCTAKDLPKIGMIDLGGCPIWSIEIAIHIIAGLEPLEERLQKLLAICQADQVD